MHWGHFLAIAAVVLALSAVLLAQHWNHQVTTATLYSSFLKAHWSPDGSKFAVDDTGDDANLKTLRDVTREGAKRARSLNFEATVWAVLFVVLLVALLFYHAWTSAL